MLIEIRVKVQEQKYEFQPVDEQYKVLQYNSAECFLCFFFLVNNIGDLTLPYILECFQIYECMQRLWDIKQFL